MIETKDNKQSIRKDNYSLAARFQLATDDIVNELIEHDKRYCLGWTSETRRVSNKYSR